METITYTDEQFIGSPSEQIRGGYVQRLGGAFTGCFVLLQGYHEHAVRVMDLDEIRAEIMWFARIWFIPTDEWGRNTNTAEFRRAAAEWWADVYRYCAGDA